MCKELERFVAESNRIEGINTWTLEEYYATRDFLNLKESKVADLVNLVRVLQPGAVLRDRPGLDVRVGSHLPPPGGEEVVDNVETILNAATEELWSPFQVHVAYEALHPFTDANGRSGRALWAWMMVRRQEGLSLGFLHRFYYQTLAEMDSLRHNK